MAVMKRSFIILCALACICACTKEEEKIVNEPEIDSPSLSELSFNFKINHYGIEDQTTKAVKSGWEDGDVVYVFFSTVTAPKYLKMTYDGATWSSVEMNGASEGSIGLTESGTMTAVFLPFANSATISADGEAFSFSKQDYAYYLTCVKEPYTVSGNSVSGILNMSVPDGFVQFFITDSDASDGILTLSEDHMTSSAVTGVAADGSLSIDNKSKGENMSGYAYGEGGYEVRARPTRLRQSGEKARVRRRDIRRHHRHS